MNAARPHSDPQGGVIVVGSGTMFISGVSHYTRYVSAALSERTPTAAILMRRLIPRSLYPGRARVGEQITGERYPAAVEVLDGVDWYWGPPMLRALALLRRRRPRALVLQWWTGAVLHSYLLLALAARLQGTRVIVELHELQDTGEAALPMARSYMNRAGGWLMRLADAFVVHSEHDRSALRASYPVAGRPCEIALHGPYSHYDVAAAQPLREAPPAACNILFFGTIRPYKGLEDLVRAFELLIADGEDCWLTVVGETWEGWDEPLRLIERSPARGRITLVNRYVTDVDAARWCAGADIVALPYRRSSASGPLHMAMDAGLPVVVGDVGGLREACAGYEGAILAAPADPLALRAGIARALASRGERFEHDGSWDRTAEVLLGLAGEPRERVPASA